jgi:hypothetical protein
MLLVILYQDAANFDVLLTVPHLSIFILVINQLDAQNFGWLYLAFGLK